MRPLGFHWFTIDCAATPMDQEVPTVKVDDLQKQRPATTHGKTPQF